MKMATQTAFITGTFRSGTSLILTALNTHEKIMIAWQPFWLFFKEVRNKFFQEVIKIAINKDYPLGTLQFASEDEAKLFRDVLNLVEFKKSELADLMFRIKAYLARDDGEMNKGMKPVKLVQYLNDIRPGTGGEILEQLMSRLRLWEEKLRASRDGKVRKEVLGVKEVFCDEFIGPILENGGSDTVAVHMVRDPRAVVASRNYGRYFEVTGSKYPIFLIIRSWLTAVATYLDNKVKDRYWMIRYEDLVTSPRKTLETVCKVLKVDFREKMLDVARYTDAAGNPWATNSSFENHRTLSTSSIDQWVSVLSDREIELIEYFCESEMKCLGYQVTNSYFDLDRIHRFKEDERYIRDWLRKFYFGPEEDVLNHVRKLRVP